MKKGIFLLAVGVLVFGLDLTFTKAFNNYKKGLKLLKSDPPKARVYFEESLKLFKKLVKENKASSQTYFFLGRMYCNGEGTKVDYKKAEKYFLKALSLGNQRATCCLARLYIKTGKLNKAKKYLAIALSNPGVRIYCTDIDAQKMKIINH